MSYTFHIFFQQHISTFFIRSSSCHSSEQHIISTLFIRSSSCHSSEQHTSTLFIARLVVTRLNNILSVPCSYARLVVTRLNFNMTLSTLFFCMNLGRNRLGLHVVFSALYFNKIQSIASFSFRARLLRDPRNSSSFDLNL
uniref:Uncharacterized protein n=1 Tax=Cacopsylla melanoneura TaxID=428564 RepID=A0A8D9F7L0_9HEMI